MNRARFRALRSEWQHWAKVERLLDDSQTRLKPADWAAWKRTVRERKDAAHTLYRAAYRQMMADPAA